MSLFIKNHGGFLLLFLLATLLVSCGELPSAPYTFDSGNEGTLPKVSEKIDGVALVAPPDPMVANDLTPIVEVNAGWVQVIPYAFSQAGKPGVNFDYQYQWWGETEEGAAKTIEFAKEKGLKVLVKPHVWVREHGWAGEFTLNNKADWLAWEANYQRYIMTFAGIAEELGADMICLGTEYRQVVKDRPDYFGRLADSVRTVFSGPVTYAANWDNYEHVEFWDKLDYIGIDAYWPLVDAKTPKVKDLEAAWQPMKKDLKKLAERTEKPILFTEYGYLSVDKAGWRTWELEHNLNTHPLNLEAQANCYQGLYNAFWDEPWFAGGFTWHWYKNHSAAGGNSNRDWTPQNKPAMEVMKKRYE